LLTEAPLATMGMRPPMESLMSDSTPVSGKADPSTAFGRIEVLRIVVAELVRCAPAADREAITALLAELREVANDENPEHPSGSVMEEGTHGFESAARDMLEIISVGPRKALLGRS
jgi:hypothetical protein